MNNFALLLDDNLMTTARVRSQLEKLNYRVQTARRLPESLSLAPDFVIINLGSRGLPGMTLISDSLQQFPASRVVGFCGHAEIEIRQKAKQAGLKRILTNDEALMNIAGALGISNDAQNDP